MEVVSTPSPVKLKIKKLYEDAVIPKYATSGSACFDIRSHYRHDILPGETKVIGTALAIEVPKGFFLELRPRSGIASEGIMIANSLGTIDSDYRGEVKVILHNFGNKVYKTYKGDRIAQGMVREVLEVEIAEVKRLTETERGEGGLGSTGK